MLKCKVSLNESIVDYTVIWTQVELNPGVYKSKCHDGRFVSLGHGDVLYISKNGIERIIATNWGNYKFLLTSEKVEISILPS